MKKSLLSLFSGCGGMDIGFEGGFKVLHSTLNKHIHSDWISYEDEKYINLKETIFNTKFANDIRKEAKSAWLNYFSKRGKTEEIYNVNSVVDLVKDYKNGNKQIFPLNIDIVTGGFPCQDFSVSGKRKGFNSYRNHLGEIIKDSQPTIETRGKLYMWMKEVVEITSPKIFIAENVKGLSNLGKVKDIIQSDFSNINGDGYIVLDPKILNAANFGVPQSRERIFFIGFKKSALSSDAFKELTKINVSTKYSPYPDPTHCVNTESNYSLFDDKLYDYVSCKRVLEDLLEPNYTDDLSQINFSKAKFMGKHCQGQKEIDLNKLAPTIRAEHHGNIEFRRLSRKNGGLHIKELETGNNERRLTLRECARIQTFPDDYDFVIPLNPRGKRYLVSPSIGYKLVGNAVPPLLAYHIAKKIEKNWSFYFNE